MDAFAWSRIVINVCWLLFVVFWVIAAFSTKRTVYRETRTSRTRYIGLIVGAFLLIAFARLFPYPLRITIVPRMSSIALLAAALCVVGLAVAFWARVTLGRNWSGLVTLKEEHELVQRGPYRFVRHPIYSGVIMMLIATTLLAGRVASLAALILIVAGLWSKLRAEEELMLAQFPEQYAAYRRRVRRLIPFVL